VIPFNRPLVTGAEPTYINEAIRKQHLSGDGPFTKRCQALLEEQVGARRALLTTSCTDALELSALLLDLAPGDEVIVPSFTFVSTVNAFVLRGARPSFVDIRRDTLNLDEGLLEAAIGPRTRAIVVVHYAGVACDMDTITAIAERRRIPVIEDNAHGLFGSWRGRPLGSFGGLATQSFHETKNFTCGEGGALLINDERFLDRAEILREKGTNRSRFFRGQVDKYSWIDIGSSFLPSELNAAFLLAQLERWREVQSARQRLWNRYREALADWAPTHGIGLPQVPTGCDQAYHMFYLVMPSLDERQRFIARLRERGVHAVFHYLPLHLSEMGRKLGGKEGQCPVTEELSDRVVRLPFYFDLSEQEQEQVIDAVRASV
jgi:dTDP-4-amino-4,6-dideoxygalactose transaminase